jgi:hypothetical protein
MICIGALTATFGLADGAFAASSDAELSGGAGIAAAATVSGVVRGIGAFAVTRFLVCATDADALRTGKTVVTLAFVVAVTAVVVAIL